MCSSGVRFVLTLETDGKKQGKGSELPPAERDHFLSRWSMLSLFLRPFDRLRVTGIVSAGGAELDPGGAQRDLLGCPEREHVRVRGDRTREILQIGKPMGRNREKVVNCHQQKETTFSQDGPCFPYS